MHAHAPAVVLARSDALPDAGTSSSYDSSPCILKSSSTAPDAIFTVRPTTAPLTRLLLARLLTAGAACVGTVAWSGCVKHEAALT